MFEFHVYCTILVIVKLLLKIMKEYLLKQLKATCALSSIACKINFGLVKNNGNPGGMGGLWPWKSGWEGGHHSDPGNPGGRGGQKILPSIGGCGFFLE